MSLFAMRIPVTVVSGEFGTGKTMTILTTGYPSERVLLYDMEKGAETYAEQAKAEGHPFTRVDIMQDVVDDGAGAMTLLEVFVRWRRHMQEIEAEQYDVIGIDTIEKIEKGLQQWVAGNPGQFGVTAQTYSRMSGVFWGHVKDYWNVMLLDLAAKCKMVILTAHMRNKYVGNKPSKQRERKGKDTLSELATLELVMVRKADAILPDAQVLKSRLVHGAFSGDPTPVLGTYISKFSWAKVQELVKQPGELELAPAKTDEERLAETRAHEALLAEAKLAEAEATTLKAEMTTQHKDTPQRAASVSNGQKCSICAATGDSHAPWCKVGDDGERFKDEDWGK